MKKNSQTRFHRWCAVATIAMLAACSSTSQVAEKDGAVAATAAETATPAAAVAEPGGPAAAAAAPAGATQAAATAPKKRAGYRLRKRGNETVYCRKETTLGTNIPQELCYTEEQIAEIEHRTDAVTEDMRQRMNVHICAPNCSN